MIDEKTYELCNKAIEDYINSLTGIPEPLYGAMKYAVLNGGKRLRPILAVTGAKTGEGLSDKIMKLAVALELIHCYSLIHDDLPCMDNDTMRRGKPTVHIMFNEAIALLAGDALLNQGFQLLSEIAAEDPSCAAACAYIARMSGSTGMIAGQCMDIMQLDKNADHVVKMYALKTSCLFKAALCGGAIAARAPEKTIRTLETFADNLGIAFQIEDDLLDVQGETSITGKNTGSDAAKEKPTLIMLMGLSEAVNCKRIYEDIARASAASLNVKEELLKIVDALTSRKN